MGLFDDFTVYKRSKKAQKTAGEPKWNKLKFNNQSLDITRKITIGRDASNDISFKDDTMISRKHAEIEVVKDSVFISDLGSTNGTHVNKEPLAKNKKRKLKPGDVIYIGSQRLKLT